MTDEEKKEVKECRCCSELGKFFTLTASIFLGTLLAILVASALLKPKCPCPYGGVMPPRPVIERQIPMNGTDRMPIRYKEHKKFQQNHEFRTQSDKLPATPANR